MYHDNLTLSERQQLAIEVCRALGPAWKVTFDPDNDSSAYMEYADIDCVTLSFGVSYSDGRVHVGTHVESDNYELHHGLTEPGIRMATSKRPATMAAEIRRRLLPDAIEYTRVVRGRIKERNDVRRERATLAKRLWEVLCYSGGAHVQEPRNDHDKPRVVFNDGTTHNDVSGHMEVWNAASVTIEIRTTGPNALRIAALLAELRRQ